MDDKISESSGKTPPDFRDAGIEKLDGIEKREDAARGDSERGIFDFDVHETTSDKYENPLADISKRKLLEEVETFCRSFDLMEHVDMMKKGALVAQSPLKFRELDELSEDEKHILEMEKKHRWKHPFMLYWLVIMCSMGAATQGMDESVNNGAVSIYPKILGISKLSNATWIEGLVVGAPYLACAVIGCWINEPLNRWFARRGTIFISCFVAAAASIWEAFTYSWPQLFAARFVLGLGIGAKSSTIPVYTAECAPAPIRGALVMQWQVWTAFGIMLGDIVGVIFGPSDGIPRDLSWRLMLGSTVLMPTIVCIQVFFCPESPRWLIENHKVKQAYTSFRRIRNTDLEACRDLFYTYVGVEIERRVNTGKSYAAQVWELFSIPRNARATWATWIVMFGQQFCGVNVIAYYSTEIFVQGGFSETNALLFSMGTGILNWVFALPAFFTIDTFGRRFLLLVTFPFLAISLLWTGFSFWIGDGAGGSTTARTAMIATGMYIFEVFYSPGMGPVPFSYSAEAFPIQVRDVGMSWATATTWCFNFILSFTWPSLLKSFKPQGAFGWYAAWCIILWFLVLLFFPETKELTLEELDAVFSVPTHKQAIHGMKEPPYWINKYVLRRKVTLEPLVDLGQKYGGLKEEDMIGAA